METVIEKVARSPPKKSKKKPPVPKPKPKPSKYMAEIIRLNFVDLVKKVDEHEAKNRVEALRKVRRHLAK